MNILDYIDRYAEATFEQVPFNEVDAMLFAELAYVNLENIIPSYLHPQDGVLIKDWEFSVDWHTLTTGSVDASFNKTMLKKMKKSLRFGSVRCALASSKFSPDKFLQFAAYTFFLPDGTMILSFRGTDTTLVGWKEDFLLTYKDTIPSQKESIAYAKHAIANYPDRPLYCVGHSKGGNLAFYTALHLEEKDFARLKAAYSFDGPGFRIPPEHFEERKHKLIKFMTRNDIIGVFYNLIENPEIVPSSGLLLGGHDPFYWSVNRKSPAFRRAKKRSQGSYLAERIFMRWLSSLNETDLVQATEAIAEIFYRSTTVYDLLYRGIPGIAHSKKIYDGKSQEEQQQLKATFGLLWEIAKEETKNAMLKWEGNVEEIVRK